VKTIAIDFDGVIHAYSKGWRDGSIYDEPMRGAFDAIRSLMGQGIAVFVHTTRPPKPVARWIEQRTGYGIECTTQVHPLPWKRTFWNQTGVLLVTQKKLPAVVYIDDRALRFESWPQALEDLEDFEGIIAS
jgi:hypothetical protein